MRKFLVSATAAAGIYVSITSGSLGAPVIGAGIVGAHEANPLVQEARVFCYNRRTGRFMHWGRCRASGPRVFCYNRRTGRFLHWGSCRRW